MKVTSSGRRRAGGDVDVRARVESVERAPRGAVAPKGLLNAVARFRSDFEDRRQGGGARAPQEGCGSTRSERVRGRPLHEARVDDIDGRREGSEGARAGRGVLTTRS